jgi:uncharacterized repeat protein (TIGR01451 family)
MPWLLAIALARHLAGAALRLWLVVGLLFAAQPQAWARQSSASIQVLTPHASAMPLVLVSASGKAIAIEQHITTDRLLQSEVSNGGLMTYTVLITNVSAVAVTQVRIVATLPRALRNSTSCFSANCVLISQNLNQINPLGEPYTLTVSTGVSASIGTLEAKQTAQLQFLARVIGQQDGDSIEVVASVSFVSANAPDQNSAERKQITVRTDVTGENQSASAPTPIWSPEELGSTFSQDWADFDRDGDLDLALGVLNGAVVYINEAGRLRRYWSGDTSTTRRAYGVRWADFDGDGYPELVESGSYTGTLGSIAVFKWNKTSTFDLAKPITTGQSHPLGRMVVADMTKDGKLDVIATSTGVNDLAPIRLFTGTADLSLSESTSISDSASRTPLTLTIGLATTQWNNLTRVVFSDLYGFIKIITASNAITSGVQPYVLPNSGGGVYLPYDFAWGDFDGDHLPDLVASYPLQRLVRIFRNTSPPGDNVSFALSETIPLHNFFAPLAAEWSDLTGDGRADLLLATQPPLAYTFDSTQNRFTRLSNFVFQEPQGQVWSIRAARVRPSENLGMMTTNVYQPSWLYDTFQTRLAAQPQILGNANSSADSVVLGDVTGDGWVDAVTTAGSSAFIFPNNGSGSLPQASSKNVVGGNAPVATLGDLDGRGRLDLVIAAQDVVRAWYGRNFEEAFVTQQPNGSGRAVALGHADGNFILDMAIGTRSVGQPVLIYTNTFGLRTPRLAFTVPHTSGAYSLAFGDFDGDFYQDLAIAGQSAVSVYRHNPDQTYTLSQSWPTSVPATGLAWADADGDGRPELAIATAPAQVIGYDKSQKKFVQRWRESQNLQVTQLAWGDWNNDGLPELAAGSAQTSAVVFANLNSSPGLPLQLVPLWREPDQPRDVTGLAWGDINNDGLLDLAVSHNPGNTYLYKNSQALDAVPSAAPFIAPVISVTRPGTTDVGYGQSSSELATSQGQPVIALTYAAPAEREISDLRFEFRDERNGAWRTAMPATAPTTTLSRFYWNAQADGAAGSQSFFRVRALPKYVNGPVHRANISGVSPPFQTLSNTCVWPAHLRIIAPAVYTNNVALSLAGEMVERVGSSGVLTFSWNFGDGSPELVGPLQTHRYTRTVDNPNTYTITLTATPAACPSQRIAMARQTIRIVPNRALAHAANMAEAADELDPAPPQVNSLQGEWLDDSQRVALAWQQPPSAITVTGYAIYRTHNGHIERVTVLEGDIRQWSGQGLCDASWFIVSRVGQRESLPSASSFYAPGCPGPASNFQEDADASVLILPASQINSALVNTVPTVQQSPPENALVDALRPSFEDQVLTQSQASQCVTHFPLVAKSAPIKPAVPSVTVTSADRPFLPINQFDPATCDNPKYPEITLGNPGFFLDPAPSQNGDSVVFVSNQNWGENADQNFEVFLARACGITQTQVTSTTGNIFGGYNLAASSNQNSTRIVFTSDRSQTNKTCVACEQSNTNFEIFVADFADTSQSRTMKVTQVTSTSLSGNYAPSISADGRFVAFVSDATFTPPLCGNCEANSGIAHVYLAELGENGVARYTQISRGGDPTTIRDFPVVSDDGDTVVYLSNEGSGDVQAGRYQLYRSRQRNCFWRGQALVEAAKAPFAMNADGETLAYLAPDEGSIGRWRNSEITTVVQSRSGTTFSQVSMNEKGDRIAYISSTVAAGQLQTATAMLYNEANLKFSNEEDVGLSIITPTKPISGSLVIGQARLLRNGRALAITTNTGVSVVDTADLLDVKITPTLTSVVAGASLSQTFTVKNIGAFEATAVVITVSAEITNSSEFNSSIPEGSCDLRKPHLVCRYAVLNPRDSVTITYGRKLDSAQTSSLTFWVSATTSSKDPDLSNNYFSQAVSVTNVVSLSVTLAPKSEHVIAGKAITYTATIHNSGPSDARNTRLVIKLSDGAGIACEGTVRTEETNHVCSKDNTIKGDNGTITYTFVVTAPANQIEPLSIAAQAESETGSSLTQTVEISVQTEADLSVGLFAPTDATAGNPLTYTVTYTNLGPSYARSVTVGLSLTNPALAGSLVVVTDMVELANNEPMTKTFSITLPAYLTNTITATVQITSATYDPTPTNNTATATTTLQTQADVGLTVSVTPTNVYTGQALLYTVILTNTGPSDAQGIILTATLPVTTSNVTTVSPVTSSQTLTQLVWQLPSLAPQPGSQTFTLKLTVPLTAEIGLLAAVFAVTTTTPDTNSANNAITATAQVSQSVPITDIALNLSPPVTISSATAIALTASALPPSATLPIYSWQSQGNPVSSANWPTGPTVALSWTGRLG